MASKEPIGIKLSADSFTAFRQALKYEYDNLSGTAEQVLKWGAYYFIKSARKATKKARKNTKRQVVPLFSQNENKEWKKNWGVVVLSQNHRPRTKVLAGSFGMNQSEAKKISYVAVKNVGASKNSWYGALRGTNKAMGENTKVGRVSNAEYVRTTTMGTMTITNKLKYLIKTNPGIESIGLAKAAKGIALRVERRIGKKW